MAWQRPRRWRPSGLRSHQLDRPLARGLDLRPLDPATPTGEPPDEHDDDDAHPGEQARRRTALARRREVRSTALVYGATFGGVTLVVVASTYASEPQPRLLLPFVLAVLGAALVPAGLALVLTRFLQRREELGSAERSARIAAFARRNGLAFSPVPLPGTLPEPVLRLTHWEHGVDDRDRVAGALGDRGVQLGAVQTPRRFPDEPVDALGPTIRRVVGRRAVIVRRGEWVMVAITDRSRPVRPVSRLLRAADLLLDATSSHGVLAVAPSVVDAPVTAPSVADAPVADAPVAAPPGNARPVDGR